MSPGDEEKDRPLETKRSKTRKEREQTRNETKVSVKRGILDYNIRIEWD
jgi:hypothetical protein